MLTRMRKERQMQFILFIIGAIFWLLFLAAIWRSMKAQESIAENVEKIARKLDEKESGT